MTSARPGNEPRRLLGPAAGPVAVSSGGRLAPGRGTNLIQGPPASKAEYQSGETAVRFESLQAEFGVSQGAGFMGGASAPVRRGAWSRSSPSRVAACRSNGGGPGRHRLLRHLRRAGRSGRGVRPPPRCTGRPRWTKLGGRQRDEIKRAASPIPTRQHAPHGHRVLNGASRHHQRHGPLGRGGRAKPADVGHC